MAPMALGLGLGATFGGGIPSLAAMLLAAETDGLAADFTDMSMVVKDTATPANAFSGDPNSKLTYSSPSTKWILGSNGLYSSGTTLRTEYNTSGVALGCRIEEARTNLCLRSQEFDTASWTKTASTVTADQTTAPDGTSTADFLFEDSATNSHLVTSANISCTSGTTYTASVFLKQGTKRYAMLVLANSAFTTTSYGIDLQTGLTAGTPTGTALTPLIEAFPNGWYRVSFSLVATSTAQANLVVYLSNNGSWANRSYAGDGVSGCYIWGAQFEAGAFPTSPIVTAGSTVTRAADNISIATSLFPSTASAGTVYAKFALFAYGGGNACTASLNDTTSNERALLRATSGTQSQVVLVDGGVTQAAIAIAGTPTVGSSFKLLGAYALNDVNVCRNGTLGTLDTAATLPTPTQLQVGSSLNSEYLNGHLAQLSVRPRRVTDVAMQLEAA